MIWCAGDLSVWSIKYERHDAFAEHGHRKIIAILDVAVAVCHADMEDKIYAHPPTEPEPDRTVAWLLIKAHYGTRKAARLWQEFLRNAVFMKAGWDAVAVEPNVHHKAGSLGEDDDACVCVHGDDFMVEAGIDVFQDAKATMEHKVDINVISIIGLGLGTEATIVKRVLSWSPAGFPWKANPKHALDLIAWARSATTKTMRNALDELLGNEPKPYRRLEAQRPTSRWIGRTLPAASVEQMKTLQNRKCEPKRD